MRAQATGDFAMVRNGFLGHIGGGQDSLAVAVDLVRRDRDCYGLSAQRV
jgi:hypothetical protein